MIPLEQEKFSKEMAIQKGYEYFEKNVKFLSSERKRKVIRDGKEEVITIPPAYGKKVNGKIVAPTVTEIKAVYEKLTGVKPEVVKPQNTDK